ncbi:MAG: dehydrogenase [Rhizobiaceae bacterium]|nr:dehydrogenase [Rhizobiaceae bacterium]
MPLIYSTHDLHPQATALLEQAGTVRVAGALDAGTLVRESRDADIVVVRAPLPAEIFAGEHRIRAAVRHGAGLDMIPVEAATAAGVLVANVPAVNARSVAEHVIFACLALLRRFRMMDRDLRDAGWLAGREHANLTHELGGRRIGIVGMGAVGRQIAGIAHHGFGLDVLGTSRSGAGFPDFVQYRAIDELVASSDIVVLACPLTPETTGLMNPNRIGTMKAGAILVNVSRGPVVDDAALIAALKDGKLLGAALDVFTTQPLPADHPYLALDNVIVSPHMAGITEESMMRMGVGAAEEALRVLAGGLPANFRNPQVEPAYRRRFPLAQ